MINSNNFDPESALAVFYGEEFYGEDLIGHGNTSPVKCQESKLVLGLPDTLHETVMEVCYREGMKLKDFTSNSLRMLNYRLTREQEAGRNPYSAACIQNLPEASEKEVRTSVFLPESLVARVKEIAHYSKRSQKDIVRDSFTTYLLNRYSGKYPELMPLEHGEE
jgi:hypothetical protein